MTLVARDEADIVGDQIRYHLDAGVDFVVATDHRSTDGTTEILRDYEREGRLHLIRRGGEAFTQSEWVTEMARLAATEFGADWVINSDADEFWWPREGRLHDVLAAVPARFGVIRGIWRQFALRPDSDEPFYESLLVRRAPDADARSPYHAQVKAAHRAAGRVLIPEGNHDALGERLILMREWYPFEVLHFPMRSREQLERKYRAAWAGHRLDESLPVPRHIEAMASGLRTSPRDVHEAFVVEDAALAAGLSDGLLAIDTRLRDRLRGVEAGAQTRPSLADDAALAAEIDGALLDNDAAHLLAARVEALERRLAAVETNTAVPGRSLRTLARAVRRGGRAGP